jgi:cell wall-associated NlpC family hydrolase
MSPTPRQPAPRLYLALALCVAAFVLLACGGGAAVSQGVVTGESPRWACPSPTPLPYGAGGPVKEWIDGDPLPTTSPSGPVRHEQIPIYYEKWEQEYPDAGGPPFPSPTTYSVMGTTFSQGQRVRIPPLFVTVGARMGNVQTDGRQLYRIDVTWINPTEDSIPIDYGSQLQITGISASAGKVITAIWSADTKAMDLNGGGELPSSIPPGSSGVVVPILAPPGEVQTIALTMLRNPSFRPRYAATQDPEGPTPTTTPTIAPETPTATPNTDLRGRSEESITVQFVSASPTGPRCGSPGAITEWETKGHEGDMNVPVAAPPGASRVVQLALNQVGRRYIWGAKGPLAFDCSGLASWSYGQIGISIPNGTANQWPKMRVVAPGNIQPGDLVFFAIGGGAIDHVGILTGDINGDGSWDMVHAASPSLGVRVDYNIFDSSYYAPRIRGFRTAR